VSAAESFLGRGKAERAGEAEQRFVESGPWPPVSSRCHAHAPPDTRQAVGKLVEIGTAGAGRRVFTEIERECYLTLDRQALPQIGDGCEDEDSGVRPGRAVG